MNGSPNETKSSFFPFFLMFLIAGIQACATLTVDKALLPAETFPLKGDAIYLDIPDRAWAFSRPDKRVGWCGEVGIQMAMLYYGKYVPQEFINRAGRPDHPDLYENDIDEALRNLSVNSIAWTDSAQGIDDFVKWIKKHISYGFPVLCGVKIYPDEHPDWFLDHFVLAVGFDERGLILNTNLDADGQQLITYNQLSSYNEGYSFKNKFNQYFGRAITGIQ